ncbi:MAG: septal ring lytic transglycosylase RlpA family protein [Polaromonas sp.]|uniref:septal ring lytic transglycosylase RlpA family protein n=1 Tax=Polaromonas sp. TaxID=1869339 RepID=UPI0027324A1C|nr:septal ring lytic transglycosylase RlpA family protein [Polaromonas sp.]MDP3797749.1 septal ring lytic transglycosylase RlpA family protein [Polaromonas sp.]
MHKGAVRVWIVASLLAVLTGCATAPPAPPRSSFPPGPAARPAVTVPPAPADPMDGPAPANLSVAPEPELLAGEAARELARGRASWYGPRFHGRRTASGERYDMYALTAAHKTLPFGTLVRVRSLVTGREVEVRINDRGPFGAGRVIDVSRAAAEALGMMGLGVKDVLLMVPESTPMAEAPVPPVIKKQRRRAPRVR